jgi:hypothetical protein
MSGFFDKQLLETAEGLLSDNSFAIQFSKAWRVALYFRTRIVGEVLISGASITVNLWVMARAAVWIFGSDLFGCF